MANAFTFFGAKRDRFVHHVFFKKNNREMIFKQPLLSPKAEDLKGSLLPLAGSILQSSPTYSGFWQYQGLSYLGSSVRE